MDLHLNPDGPYSDDLTREASKAVAECVRYLGHATRHREAATGPSVVGDAVDDLALALDRLRQVCRQLADRLADQQATGLLYDDREREPGPAVTAAREELWEVGRDARALAARLNVAAQIISHLGMRDEQDGGAR